MLIFRVKNITRLLTKSWDKYHFYIPLHVRCFKSQTPIFQKCNLKLTQNDTKILHFLCNQRFHEAHNLLGKMAEKGQLSSVVHWTSLLTKYSKHGFVDEARALFDIMPERNVVTYNAMLTGFVQYGRLNEAWNFFEEMPERNVVSWTLILNGLMDSGRIYEAIKFFHDMPERNVVSWNSMVVGLIRNNDIEGARHVFDAIPEYSVVSWNAMISGYAENCRMEEARVLFEEMDIRNVVTWTSIIAGYCRVGDVDEAYCLFQRMPEKNIVSWTAMIGGFAWNGFYERALWSFLDMTGKNEIKPNGETFISLAYASAGIGFRNLGKQLHVQVIVNGWEHDDYGGRLSRSLIHMYSSFGLMDSANYLFTENSFDCTVESSNSLINGYIKIGKLEEAQNLFETVPSRDKVTWTSMIDGYLGVGYISRARYLFRNMPDRDGIAWTTIISGLIQNELFAEATSLFFEMRALGCSPLYSTYAVLFGATGAMANLEYGRHLHCLLLKTRDGFDLIVENSLISMYAKCGEIGDAYNTFLKMSSRDLVSWNSMIMGFSHHGLANKALRCFNHMLESGTCPNSVTFLGILSACSHAGLINRGLKLYKAMNDVYGVQSGLEHNICMINLLGRAGKVKEAEEFVMRLPSEPNPAIWGALLGVCGLGQKHVEIGKRAAKRLLLLDPLNPPAHVVLCNIYATNGQYVEERKLRKEMELKGVKKIPGCSWVMLNGTSHVFVSGDRLPPQMTQMLLLLFHKFEE